MVPWKLKVPVRASHCSIMPNPNSCSWLDIDEDIDRKWGIETVRKSKRQIQSHRRTVSKTQGGDAYYKIYSNNVKMLEFVSFGGRRLIWFLDFMNWLALTVVALCICLIRIRFLRFFSVLFAICQFCDIDGIQYWCWRRVEQAHTPKLGIIFKP